MGFKSIFDKIKSSVKETADQFRTPSNLDEDFLSAPPPEPPPLDAPSESNVTHRSESAPARPAVRTETPQLSSGQNKKLASPVLRESDPEESSYMRRSESVNAVEAMFAEFGPKVCAYVLTNTLMPGGIGRVVQKLGLRSRGRQGADMAVVENFLRQQGVEEFARLTGIKLVDDGSTPPPPEEKKKQCDSSDPRLKVKVIDKPKTPKRRSNVGLSDTASQEFVADSSNQSKAHIHKPQVQDGANAPPSHLRQVSVKPMNLRDSSEPEYDHTPLPVEQPQQQQAPQATKLPKKEAGPILPQDNPATSNSANEFILKELLDD